MGSPREISVDVTSGVRCPRWYYHDRKLAPWGSCLCLDDKHDKRPGVPRSLSSDAYCSVSFLRAREMRCSRRDWPMRKFGQKCGHAELTYAAVTAPASSAHTMFALFLFSPRMWASTACHLGLGTQQSALVDVDLRRGRLPRSARFGPHAAAAEGALSFAGEKCKVDLAQHPGQDDKQQRQVHDQLLHVVQVGQAAVVG